MSKVFSTQAKVLKPPALLPYLGHLLPERLLGGPRSGRGPPAASHTRTAPQLHQFPLRYSIGTTRMRLNTSMVHRVLNGASKYITRDLATHLQRLDGDLVRVVTASQKLTLPLRSLNSKKSTIIFPGPWFMPAPCSNSLLPLSESHGWAPDVPAAWS